MDETPRRGYQQTIKVIISTSDYDSACQAYMFADNYDRRARLLLLFVLRKQDGLNLRDDKDTSPTKTKPCDIELLMSSNQAPPEYIVTTQSAIH
ncbi:hypothetical protein V6N13_069191 [Hibiscus sabdariffa]